MQSSCSVRVICRFRPVNEREKREGASADEKTLSFPAGGQGVRVRGLDFTLDKVFSGASQDDVYAEVRTGVEDVLRGFNATIFAYGQTGAGKSFTMFGELGGDPRLRGIIPRACAHIFDHIAQDESGTEWQIKCSFLEIYMENVKDMLSAEKTATSLKVRETPAKGVWVEGLTEEFVTSEQEVLDVLRRGERQRSVSSTHMNETSSRSHSLFVLTVIQRLKDGSTRTGKLNLGDLAGSEKVGKTGATGTTLEEAKKINQSLSALGNCINALTKEGAAGGGPSHVPYRDSKLTFILRESLGGNTKTTLIVACSPHPFNIEETVSTLRFAQRAKSITNVVSVNQKRSVEELELIVKALMEEIAGLKKKLAAGGGGAGGGGGGGGGAGEESIEKLSDDLRAKEEASEALMQAQYEISSLKKELSEIKSELVDAKLRDEEFAAQRQKWQFDETQLQLQLQSERLSTASAVDRATKLAEERDRMSAAVSDMEAQAKAADQRAAAKVRQLTEQLEAADAKNGATQHALDLEKKAAADAKANCESLSAQRDKLQGERDALEKQLRDAHTAARERELVLSALQRDVEQLRAGTTMSNDALSELKAELLQTAKNLNSAQSENEAIRMERDEGKRALDSARAELEELKAKLAESESARDKEVTDLKAQLQAKARELVQRDAMHEEVLFRETAAVRKEVQHRDAENRQLMDKLSAARRDLDEQQSKYLIQLKQQEQRNKRIHSLEEELAGRNAMIKELKVSGAKEEFFCF